MAESPEKLGYATSGPDWIRIAAYSDVVSAHMARLRLEAEDIPCVLEDENIGVTMWYAAPVLGGIKLRVPADQAELARTLLDNAAVAQPEVPDDSVLAEATIDDEEPGSVELAAAAGEPEELSTTASGQCPRCQEPAERYPWSRRISLAMLVLIPATVGAIGVDPLFAVAGAGVLVYLLATKPEHRCAQCGHNWSRHDLAE